MDDTGLKQPNLALQRSLGTSPMPIESLIELGGNTHTHDKHA